MFFVGCFNTLNPSPCPTEVQLAALTPPAAALGPNQEPLSCKPP